MSNTRPNLKLRPNFNIKSQVQEEPVQEEPVPVKQEPKINTRPFIRPPSSKKEETRQSIVMQEPLAESKVDEQKQQRRTPINGFRKFNLQAPQPAAQEDVVQNSQFQGPVINMKAKKEKIQQEVMQLQQEELRQKVQVKIQSRPLNQPEANIFKPPEANEGAEIFKKGKAIRPTKQMEPITKDTIKVSELLENKIKFTTPAVEEEEDPKPQRTRAPQTSVAETIQIEQQPTEKPQVTNKKMTKTTKKQIKEVVQLPEEPIAPVPEVQEEKQVPKTIDDYKERSIPKFNTTENVSQGKKESQKQRVKELRQLISLEIDDYSNQLVIQPRSEYETYLNHIKANILRNSCDQAFDDRITIDTQTDEFQTNDFGGQCPEDYNRTFLAHRQQQKNNRLSEFIEMACEIMEEILSQDNSNTQQFQQDQFSIPKQISSTFKCKYLNVVTHNDSNIFQSFYIENDENKWLNGSIVLQSPNTIYYIPSQITTLTCNSNFLVCGNSDGQLAGWSLSDKGFSNKYTDKIKTLLKDQFNVKCLFFSSEWNLQILDQFAESYQLSQIQSVQFNNLTLIHEVVAMDVFGNIQIWQIQDLRYDEQEKLYVELGIKSKYKFILRSSLNKGFNKICSNMSVSTDNILICGPNKVINVNQLKSYFDDSYMQPIVISNIYNNYFCVGYVDGFIKLFHKDFSKSIWSDKGYQVLWLALFNGIIIVIDKQQQLHIYDLNIKLHEAIVNKQIGTSDNQKFSYSYIQGNDLCILVYNNKQLQLFKEHITMSKTNILDTLYQDYYAQ